jgi:hypothetical protein
VKSFVETLRVTNPVGESRASSRKRVSRGDAQPSLRGVDSEINLARKRSFRTSWSEEAAALWTRRWSHAEDTVPHHRVPAK